MLLTSFNYVNIQIMFLLAYCLCGVVYLVVIGDRSQVFKTEQEKIFILAVSIILCADSVVTYASLDQTLCFNNVNDQKITKKCLR